MQLKRHSWLAHCFCFGLLCTLGSQGCDEELHELDGGAAHEGSDASAVVGDDDESAPVATDASTSDASASHVTDAAVTVPAHDAGSPPATDAAAGGGSSDGGKLCGTRGAAQCGAKEYCDFALATHCGAADEGGSCKSKPEVCTDIYAPVCGCDGKTYPSACNANGAGVSVASQGACKTDTPTPGTDAGTGKICGGFAGFQCEGTDEFCNYEVAAGGQGCEGIADGSGKCQSVPQACTADYSPVCGCDHRTYGNACDAHSKGVSVLRTGMCTDTDCKAIGGHAVDGIGPPPMCASGETDYGAIRYAGGQASIEGTICCVK